MKRTKLRPRAAAAKIEKARAEKRNRAARSYGFSELTPDQIERAKIGSIAIGHAIASADELVGSAAFRIIMHRAGHVRDFLLGGDGVPVGDDQ